MTSVEVTVFGDTVCRLCGEVLGKVFGTDVAYETCEGRPPMSTMGHSWVEVARYDIEVCRVSSSGRAPPL